MNDYRVPGATYRLQFNRNFKFAAAKALVPYLHELGITDIYASPLFQATRGSLHGYSVTNPMALNSELGSPRTFDGLARSLKANDMGLLFDIVPNHMALSSDNPWWLDVLEDGHGSPYTVFFDINWRPPNRILEGKVLLPILGRPYGQVLEDREFRLSLEPHGISLNYYEHKFPLTPKTYLWILAPVLERLTEELGEENPATIALMGIVRLIDSLPPRTQSSSRKVKARQRDKEIVKKNLWMLYQGSPEVKQALDEVMEACNGRKGEPASFDGLDQILQEQPYRLAFWQVALEIINYRRFFSINDLIGIRIEDPQVFEAFKHGLLLRLVSEGKVTGLRIDHIDGLFDPLEYLQRLQRLLAKAGKTSSGASNFYLAVEKVLASGEGLPPAWPVAGTTGYDFLNQANGLFVNPRGLEKLRQVYADFVQTEVDLPELIADKKKLIMAAMFGGEVENHVYYLSLMARHDRQARDLARRDLAEALVEVLARLPIYRTYIRGPEITSRDLDYLRLTFAEVRRIRPHLNRLSLEFLERVLRLEFPPYLTNEQRQDWLKYVMHLQQFTGPIMAKSFEDTVLYIYNPLISLNEVGGSFEPVTAADFHRFNRDRLKGCPHTMNATSTHDTKRSEDVRARLNVLSEIPGEWQASLHRWSGWNGPKKIVVQENQVPDRNQEALLYQTLLGAWPLDPDEVPTFRERLKSYMIKAAREAMAHTRWTSPQEEHEKALLVFVDAILDEAGNQEFLADFLEMEGRLAYFGALNSLAQVVLKIAAPGVPDFYQGTELWDFSLVDPDNRRPVDFSRRIQLLDDLKFHKKHNREKLLAQLLGRWQDGRLKLFITYQALNQRRDRPELFREGDYLPLQVKGGRRQNVIGLARHRNGDWVLAVAGRFFTGITQAGQPPLGRETWGNTALVLPPKAPQRWQDVFSGRTWEARASETSAILPIEQIFQHLPVALLVGAA